jgi:hypothetical protein
MNIGSFLPSILGWSHGHEALEVFAEEGRVGEVHLFGYLCHRFFGMA